MSESKTETSSKIFCQNVRFLGEKNLTQAETAEKLSISVNSLRSLEKGEVPPRLSCGILIRIHTVFGIHPKDIFLRWKNEHCRILLRDDYSSDYYRDVVVLALGTAADCTAQQEFSKITRRFTVVFLQQILEPQAVVCRHAVR